MAMEKSREEYIQDCKAAVFKLKPKEIRHVFARQLDLNAVQDNNDLYTQGCAILDRTAGKHKAVLNTHEHFFIKKLHTLFSLYELKNEYDEQNRINMLLVGLIEDISTCSNAGCAFLAKGEKAKAIMYNKKAFTLLKAQGQICEDDWQILNNYMYCLNSLSKYEKMIDILEEEIMKWEKNLKRTLGKLKKDPEAEASAMACGHWWDITRYLVSAYVWAGIAYDREYQPKKAIRYYNTCKKYEHINFNNEFLYNALANHYIDQGEYDTAKAYVQKALKDDPNNSEAYTLYGLVCTFLGNKTEAKIALLKAYKADPKDPGIKHNLLLCLTETGDLFFPTPCEDEDAFIDTLIENGEAEKIIKKLLHNG